MVKNDTAQRNGSQETANVSFSKWKKGDSGFMDRAATYRVSAIYAVCKDGEIVAFIERAGIVSYMKSPYWDIAIPSFFEDGKIYPGPSHRGSYPTLKAAKAAAIKKF